MKNLRDRLASAENSGVQDDGHALHLPEHGNSAHPSQRLQGDGKQMRHVRFGADETIDTAHCQAMIEKARRV